MNAERKAQIQRQINLINRLCDWADENEIAVDDFELPEGESVVMQFEGARAWSWLRARLELAGFEVIDVMPGMVQGSIEVK